MRYLKIDSPVNEIFLSYRSDDLFCIYCGKKIWNARGPDLLEECEHLLFNYGLGQFFQLNSRLMNLLKSLHILDDDYQLDDAVNSSTLEKVKIVCNELYGNFLLISEDMCSNIGSIGIAEFYIEGSEYIPNFN